MVKGRPQAETHVPRVKAQAQRGGHHGLAHSRGLRHVAVRTAKEAERLRLALC